MSASKKGLLLGCVLYFALLIWVFWMHSTKPANEFIILGILGLPLNLIFFVFAGDSWSDIGQDVAIIGLGFIQYGCVGFLIGKALEKSWTK